MRRRAAIALGAVLLFGACTSERRPPRTSQTELAGLPATTVRVLVRGPRNFDGRIALVLFDAPDGFPSEPEKAVRRMESAIEADPVEFAIENVPAGTYAVSILHDEDADGEMETGWFGRPKEGYGFSRDATGTFGPPSFDEAMFEVLGEPIVVEITLTYH